MRVREAPKHTDPDPEQWLPRFKTNLDEDGTSTISTISTPHKKCTVYIRYLQNTQGLYDVEVGWDGFLGDIVVGQFQDPTTPYLR